MKKLLTELLTFVLFVASIVCFYLSLTAFFASVLLNIISFFTGVFLLVHAAGFIDRAKGFGPKANSDSNSNDNNQPQQNEVINTTAAPTEYEGDEEI